MLTPPAPLTPLKMASPGRAFTQPGLSFSDKRTRKPNSVLCGHSSRRRVAADVHQRPTRRFRALHAAALSSCACQSPLNASGRHAAPPGSGRTLPSLFGLAPCGVYPAAAITVCAVRSYRTFSPLPLHGADFWTRFSDIPQHSSKGLLHAMAVCFLWHWPSMSLNAHVPDVIRHTALWSSDFPLPKASGCPRNLQQRPPGPPARH